MMRRRLGFVFIAADLALNFPIMCIGISMRSVFLSTETCNVSKENYERELRNERQTHDTHRTTGDLMSTITTIASRTDAAEHQKGRVQLTRNQADAKLDRESCKDNVIDDIGMFYLVLVGVSREIYIHLFPKQRKEESGLLPRCR